MYSRKFGQNGLPPDYGGISFRQPPPEKQSAPCPEPPDGDCQNCMPRYPTESLSKPTPTRIFSVRRKTPKKAIPPPIEPIKDKEPRKPGGLSALTSHSFTMEDIVLAGLILLLLNSDCDSELLLILGFLLLVGLQ